MMFAIITAIGIVLLMKANLLSEGKISALD
jgi:hypothetical protein